MQAVLYVGHGSRCKDGVNQAAEFVWSAMKKAPVNWSG